MNLNINEQSYIARLKSVPDAVITQAPTEGRFYHYEPGNGTRYEVFITSRGPSGHRHDEYYPHLAISVMNFDRPCSMTVPMFDGAPDIDPYYMAEKMNIEMGDALALVKLIEHHLKEE